ncbi:MAG: hypothetical protein ABF508_09035 [Zymomonas mobilis]|uniref:hypothetical protein n=1 Tax=Zymomonas mobilis TaxID=542 RepID=UPI0039EC207C
MPQSNDSVDALMVKSLDMLVATLLATRKQADMIAVLKRVERPVTSRQLRHELSQGIKTLAGHIDAKRHKEAKATILALLFIDANYVIPKLRRTGVLRASKYRYNGHLIGTIIKVALQITSLMNTTPERVRYLETVSALAKLAVNARRLYDQIVNALKGRREMVLKTLLVIINSKFYNEWLNDRAQASTVPHYYSAEEYTEAVSLIFSIYASLFPITEECCNQVDTNSVIRDPKSYDRLLYAALRIMKFKEAEILVDGFPYQATLEDRTVTISSSDPDIEKSVRLGYIQNEQQMALRASRLCKIKDPLLSLDDFIKRGFEQHAFDNLIQLVEQPCRHYRLILPTAPKFFSLFSDDTSFREEVEQLLLLEVNHFGDLDSLMGGITENVTTIDIFKFQRYFLFLGSLYQKRLEKIEDDTERKFLTFTSTVFVIPHDSLFMQMMLIFNDEAKVNTIIKLFSTGIIADHLDLQYRPLIDIGSHYVIAPHLLARSNLVRNTIVANRLREGVIGPEDQMVKGVVDALISADFKVNTSFKIKAGGQKMELDIVAWRDGHLFFFECKNAYHPCSVHEMRNSYDHLKVGRDQLDIRQQVFSDSANQSLLFEKLGWAVANTATVHTGIITANRIFHGASLHGHPVRHAHELINVLQNGELTIQDLNLSFWSGSTFQTNDLVTYLEGDSVATKQLAALDPITLEFEMGYRNLIFSSFALDPEKIHQIFVTSYMPSERK